MPLALEIRATHYVMIMLAEMVVNRALNPLDPIVDVH